MLRRGLWVLQIGRDNRGLLDRQYDVSFGQWLPCSNGHVRLVLDVKGARYLVREAVAECLILNCLLQDLELRLSS
jgi:hypothetical protein